MTDDVNEKVQRALARFDRVTRSLDERDGPARAAARRERQRLNRDLSHRIARVGVAIGVVSVLTIVVGLIIPIGMFGFLAAVGLAIGIAALLVFMPGEDSPSDFAMTACRYAELRARTFCTFLREFSPSRR